jgi:Human growth factor-like EGF
MRLRLSFVVGVAISVVGCATDVTCPRGAAENDAGYCVDLPTDSSVSAAKDDDAPPPRDPDASQSDASPETDGNVRSDAADYARDGGEVASDAGALATSRDADAVLAGSKCLDGGNELTCDCAGTGFAGTRCDMNADNCSPNLCRNGGTCTDDVSGYKCECKDGWEGEQCQLNIDECQTLKPCGANQECRDTPGSFECACRKVSGCEGEGAVCSLGARKYDCTKDVDGCLVRGPTEACDAGTECYQATCTDTAGCGLTPKQAGELCGTDGTCDGKGACVVTKCGDRLVTGNEQCDPLAPGFSKWTCQPKDCVKITNPPAFTGCINNSDCGSGYSCDIQKIMKPGTCLPNSCSAIQNVWNVSVVQLGEACAIACSTGSDCPPSAPDCGVSELDLSGNSAVRTCRF